jgi:hypothetical protein
MAEKQGVGAAPAARDQFPGGGHDADVAAAAFTDPVASLPEAGVAGHALHNLDRAAGIGVAFSGRITEMLAG